MHGTMSFKIKCKKHYLGEVGIQKTGNTNFKAFLEYSVSALDFV